MERKDAVTEKRLTMSENVEILGISTGELVGREIFLKYGEFGLRFELGQRRVLHNIRCTA